MVSPAFASLATYSHVPDWLTDESMLSDYWLLEMGGTHGDELQQVGYARGRVADPDLPKGVLPVIANRLASEQHLRYTGEGEPGNRQMMGHYPGDFNGPTAESRAAAGITWLVGKLAMEHLVIDRHDNFQERRFAYAGVLVRPEAMAAVHILGHDELLYSDWCSFFRAVPRGILVEESVLSDVDNARSYRHDVSQAMAAIADLGMKGLREYFFDQRVADGFSYRRNVAEICCVNPQTKQPNAEVIALLPELEASHGGDTAEPVALSRRVRDTLGLDATTAYYLCSPMYRNRSQIIPNELLGMDDGRERRILWGDLLAEQDAPVAAPDGFLRFGG